MRPGASSCDCSQWEGLAIAIVNSSGYFKRESRVKSTVNNTADVPGGRAKPATVSSLNQGSGHPECGGTGVPSTPSVGRGDSVRGPSEDVQESPVPFTRGTESGEAIPSPASGVREAARLKRTSEDSNKTVEGRMRSDICRLQALHGAAILARKIGMEAACDDSAFLAAHDSYAGSLSDFEGKFLVEGAADIAFRIESQNRANFLADLESAGKPDGTSFSGFVAIIGKELCVCMHVTTRGETTL